MKIPIASWLIQHLQTPELKLKALPYINDSEFITDDQIKEYFSDNPEQHQTAQRILLERTKQKVPYIH